MSDQVKKWYVVKAISGKEKKVKELIESEINHQNLKDFVSQVLIPTEKVYQVRKGKKISKERNFFPGYVLIEALLVGEVAHIIKNVPGVLGFLGSKGEPIPMRTAEVNRILGKVDELSEKGEEISEPFIIGESVRVIDGPFNSFSGIIEEVNEEKKKTKSDGQDLRQKNPSGT